MTWWRNTYLAYVRVSSYEQAERNVSIPSQVEQIEQYAKSNNIIVTKLFKEENSAFKGKRPVFAEMLKELKNTDGINWLLVFKFDRLSRNLDDFLKIDKIIRKKGLEILSVTEPMLNSYLGRYLVRDMQNRAILYSEELSFRIKLGLRKKLKTGWDIGGSPPFGFKRINGYFIADEEKWPVVKETFELYATGCYGYKELAQTIRKDFKLRSFTPHQVEILLNNTIYAWIRTKTWILSKEEYMFRGVERPWKFTETYELEHVQPIIPQDLFEKCKQIREQRTKFTRKPTGVAKYPSLFECSCGRKMRRDDTKWNRYLRCTNQINHTHTQKCKEKYLNINKLEPQIAELIKSFVLDEKQRKKIIEGVEAEMSKASTTKNKELLSKLKEIEELENKLKSYTDDFLEWNLDQKTYQLLSERLQKRCELTKQEIASWKNEKKHNEAGKKVIAFMKVLDAYDENCENFRKNKKSSQLFWPLFRSVANSVISDWKISSYLLNSPFDLCENSKISKYWRWWESNPRLKGVAANFYHYSLLIFLEFSFESLSPRQAEPANRLSLFYWTKTMVSTVRWTYLLISPQCIAGVRQRG